MFRRGALVLLVVVLMMAFSMLAALLAQPALALLAGTAGVGITQALARRLLHPIRAPRTRTRSVGAREPRASGEPAPDARL